jgi:hypothetical protein
MLAEPIRARRWKVSGFSGQENASVYSFAEQFSNGENRPLQISTTDAARNEHRRFCANGESLLAQCAFLGTPPVDSI